MAKSSFSVVTYNILADCYIRPRYYTNVSRAALDPRRRRARLLDVIEGLDADVYCLQEVERGAFDDIGGRLGDAYEGVYAQKRGREDGCALFTRRSAVRLIQTTTLHYEAHMERDDQLALLAKLEIDGERVALACTHLKWGKNTDPSHLGSLQMKELLARRKSLIGCDRWLIAGDLNAISQSPLVTEALQQGFALSCRAQRPWDTTNANGRARKIDYILHTKGRFNAAPGPLPRLKRDDPMPSEVHPSDHLPVRVEFEIVR